MNLGWTWVFRLGLFAAIGIASSAQGSLLDTTFDPGSGAADGIVESVVIQPDGKILICGNFTSFAGQPIRNIARLNSDGSLDPTFNPDVGYWVRSMGLQTDGKIVIGGFFNDVAGQPRNRVARLNADGSLDISYGVGTGCEGKVVPPDPTDPFVFAVAIQQDGKAVIGGNFTTYNGVSRTGIARLNTDGSLDTSFDPGSGVDSWVRGLRIRGNGQIMACGWFTSYNNQSYNRMVRINSNGTADTSFNAYFGDKTAVYSLAEQPDGKMVVVGHTISSYFPEKIARLNPDGSRDSSFNVGTGANEKVESVILQGDGKFMIGGYFTDYNGVAVGNIARLNSDGTLDSSFAASVDNWIWTLALQGDGRILFCGGFSTVDGVPRSGVARVYGSEPVLLLNPRCDGSVFQVSVATQNGKSYSLFSKDSLASTTWTPVQTITGDGTVKTLSDWNASVNTRYYRVLQN